MNYKADSHLLDDRKEKVGGGKRGDKFFEYRKDILHEVSDGNWTPAEGET
jgi:hypothetical protein